MFTASILALVKLTLYQGLKVGGAAQQVYQRGPSPAMPNHRVDERTRLCEDYCGINL